MKDAMFAWELDRLESEEGGRSYYCLGDRAARHRAPFVDDRNDSDDYSEESGPERGSGARVACGGLIDLLAAGLLGSPRA
jgi:hypothetical protein